MLWRRKKSRDEDLDREIRSHLELEAEERQEDGLSAEQARYAAKRALGNATLLKETIREAYGPRWLDTTIRDLRCSVRMLRRNRAFSLIAIAVLALGIGANTAIFSLVNSVLLRPLPFPHAGQLVKLWDSFGDPDNFAPVSYPDFRDWRAWNRTFSGMAAFSSTGFVLTGSGAALHVDGVIASADLFRVLGAQPVLGRTFSPGEDRPRVSNGADSAVLSYRFWQERFGGAADVLGRVVELDGKPFSIVGVMPPHFDSYTGASNADIWITAAILAETSAANPKPASEERGMSFLHVIGRLRPGVTVQQAQADMNRVADLLMRAYPKDGKEGVIVQGLQASVTGDLRLTLLLLLSAAGIVLLIACGDISGLVLARTTRRRREIAIRAAVGAGKWQIVRQLLTEALVLSVLGGAAGIWLASGLNRLLPRLLEIRPSLQPALDGRVFAFALFAAVLTAILFSLAPALHAIRLDLQNSLKETALAAGESLRQKRLGAVLIAGQIALAMVLLNASALLTFTLLHLQQTNLGFDSRHVLAFPVSLPETRYKQSARAAFFQEFLARVRALPGVESAAAGGRMPFRSNRSNTVLSSVAGREIPLGKRTGITYSAITPQYFQTLGIRIEEGRAFTNHDNRRSRPVVIINEAAAEKYFGSGNPIGQQVAPEMWNGSGSVTQPRTIVGVAANVKLSDLEESARPAIYWPISQIPSDGDLYVAVRTAGNPLRLARQIRAQLHRMDKDLPFYAAEPLTQSVDRLLGRPVHQTLLVALFAVLALILTMVGLYGVIAYSVAQSTHEIGIRMALGASTREVKWSFAGRGIKMTLIGIAVGTAAAIGAARLMRSVLFDAQWDSGMTLGIAAACLFAVAFLASYLPARRASKVDPMVALRYE